MENRSTYCEILFISYAVSTVVLQTTTVINRLIFFQTLRTKYDNDVLTTGGSPLLLTAAVSAGKTTVDTAYEINKISQ
jgi:hypothetical protein